jgi:pantoate--beta-alanine ligase
MNVTSDLSEIRSCRWHDRNTTWGLVPTMGALHQGHLSLIRQAHVENEKVAVSIFVNPIQFNNPGDLKTYPVALEKDLDILRREKIDLVWTPAREDIYPPDFQTYVQVEKLSEPLEGTTRPGHFKGVATIVAILLNIFQPHRAYFGQKDVQQLLVIQQMVKDLKFNLDIVPCPTIRENDGLAISSRNQNLGSQGRKQAVCLFDALSAAKKAITNGERSASRLKNLMQETIGRYSLARIDYVSIATPLTLTEVETIDDSVLLSLAVYIENIRLIDNITVENFVVK